MVAIGVTSPQLSQRPALALYLQLGGTDREGEERHTQRGGRVWIAQLIERRTRDPTVAGSFPTGAAGEIS